MTTDLDTTQSALSIDEQQACSAVEELREGFRQLELRAKEQGDQIAATVAGSHHSYADKLVVRLGGFSVREPNDQALRARSDS